MKFLKSATLAVLLGSLAADARGQTRPDQMAAMEAARKEQAAAAEKMDKAADAIIAELHAAVSANAPAKAYDDILQKISAASLTNGQRYASNPKMEAARTFATHWQDYLFAASTDKFDQVQQSLRQLVQEAAGIPIMPRSELMSLQEKCADQMVAADRALLEPMVKRFEETLARANTTAELQPFLQEVITTQAAYTRSHQNQVTNTLQIIGQIRNFIARWQEALSYSESGNLEGARNTFSNLFEDRTSFNELTAITRPYRARITGKVPDARTQPPVAMAPPPPRPEAPKSEALTVENLDDLVAYLRRGSAAETAGLLPYVELLMRARNTLREHQRATVIFNTPNFDFARLSGPYSDQLRAIRQRLMVQCIKADLNSDLTAQPDELASMYLKRIIQSALAAKDWPGAYDSLVLQRDATNASSPDDLSLISAIAAIIAGAKYEAVGQFAAAQGSYQSALASSSKFLPVKELEIRMRNLKDKVAKEQSPAAPVQAKEPSLFDDNRVNAFLLIGIVVGVFGTLGLQRLRSE